MLGATVQTKRSPESDDLTLQVSLVAGAPQPRNVSLLGRRRSEPCGTLRGCITRQSRRDVFVTDALAAIERTTSIMNSSKQSRRTNTRLRVWRTLNIVDDFTR